VFGASPGTVKVIPPTSSPLLVTPVLYWSPVPVVAAVLIQKGWVEAFTVKK
jgi:hypothetical protein